MDSLTSYKCRVKTNHIWGQKFYIWGKKSHIWALLQGVASYLLDIVLIFLPVVVRRVRRVTVFFDFENRFTHFRGAG